MNRRKAIGGILIAGAGVIAFSGYKWYNWKKDPDYSYLDNSEDLIAALAETIIPQTDSPGAKQAGVEKYILSIVRDCADQRTANTFIDGLKEVDRYSKSTFNGSFESLTEVERETVMRHFERKGQTPKGIIRKAKNKFLGKSFFLVLKEYTVTGYCTSKVGATEGLTYLYIPGAYHGCLNLRPGQKAWAL